MWKTFHSQFKGRLSGERALWQAREQYRIDRFFTFPNFERSAERCGEQMESAGLSGVAVESFPADGTTSWSGWDSMKAWDVTSARLWLVSPHHEVLGDWADVPQCLVMYSGACDVEAELVEWNGELDADLEGKIPFTYFRINDVHAQLKQLGASGIVSDFIGTLPGVRDRFDIPDHMRWENSAIRNAHGANWGFMLTPRQGHKLRELMRSGPVRLRAEIKSRVYDGVFKSATGVIPGMELSDQELLFVSHLYEPGANDNASGVGVGLELARSLNQAIKDGIVARPRRSIRFMFNWEGCGLYAWMHRHEDRIPFILGGLNIDEIGVDQAIGRSVLHLFMPPAANPSCIGDLAAHLCEELLSPQIRWKAVADRAEIINDTITADPHMDIVLPSLIQYPSFYYHSSGDTPDSLNTDVMEAIGLVSAAHLYSLADAGPREAPYLQQLVAGACHARLHQIGLRLVEGTWPFACDRTQAYLAEVFKRKADSTARFGAAEGELARLQAELERALGAWCTTNEPRFPGESASVAKAAALERAQSLVPHRVTLGAPKPWESLTLTPVEEQEYRRMLYGNNLDMLLHRICYWSDGKTSLLEIVGHLELELDELLRDTAIARTSSGTQISDSESNELDLDAVLYLVDLLVKDHYLSV